MVMPSTVWEGKMRSQLKSTSSTHMRMLTVLGVRVSPEHRSMPLQSEFICIRGMHRQKTMK